MLLVVVALIIPLIFSEENLTKQKLDSMAEDYYKNHLYSDFINSGKFDSENLEETMQIYAERGFSHVFLRQILLHEAYRDTEDAKFLREACDENKTIIQFFPDAPYTKESFHTKITYSCNFWQICYNIYTVYIKWSRSITVSTSGFHPDNAGSTPAEITKNKKRSLQGLFFYSLILGESWTRRVRLFKETRVLE